MVVPTIAVGAIEVVKVIGGMPPAYPIVDSHIFGTLLLPFLVIEIPSILVAHLEWFFAGFVNRPVATAPSYQTWLNTLYVLPIPWLKRMANSKGRWGYRNSSETAPLSPFHCYLSENRSLLEYASTTSTSTYRVVLFPRSHEETRLYKD